MPLILTKNTREFMEGTLFIIEIQADLVSTHKGICFKDIDCGRKNNGPSKMSMALPPEPVNMFPFLAQGTLQM